MMTVEFGFILPHICEFHLTTLKLSDIDFFQILLCINNNNSNLLIFINVGEKKQ